VHKYGWFCSSCSVHAGFFLQNLEKQSGLEEHYWSLETLFIHLLMVDFSHKSKWGKENHCLKQAQPA
jgi:hypothetical protein